MRLLKEIEGFISNQCHALSILFSIINLEITLAKLSIYPLLITVLMFGIVLISFWLTTSALLGYGIFWMTDNVFMALGGMLFCQGIALVFLIKYLRFNVKNMSFERTRRYLNGLSSPEKGASQNDLKKAINNKTHAPKPSTTDIPKSSV